MFLQLSVLPFSSSRIPKDVHIFREPESWEVSTENSQSPGHAQYKWSRTCPVQMIKWKPKVCFQMKTFRFPEWLNGSGLIWKPRTAWLEGDLILFLIIPVGFVCCVPLGRGFPERPRRKNLAGWFVKKNLPWGTILKFGQRARGGARTCDAPCILGRVLDSAFIQARVRLSCSGGLINTGRQTFECHASPPRAAAAELKDRAASGGALALSLCHSKYARAHTAFLA